MPQRLDGLRADGTALGRSDHGAHRDALRPSELLEHWGPVGSRPITSSHDAHVNAGRFSTMTSGPLRSTLTL